MDFTPEQLAKVKSAKSIEELLAMAKESGITLSEEEAGKYFVEMHKEGELSDEELENVAGGSQCIDGKAYSSKPPYYLITTWGNRCPAYEHDEYRAVGVPDNGSCYACGYSDGTVPMYCLKRTATNDPYR